MSQKDLVNKCAIPVNIITDYENGKSIPDRKILIKIGNILGIKLL
jgi:ribosome-binding protein aMBF1 (putative translation factor)